MVSKYFDSTVPKETVFLCFGFSVPGAVDVIGMLLSQDDMVIVLASEDYGL